MAVVGELLVLIGANGAPLTAGLAKAEGELKGFGASGTSALSGIRIAAAGVGVAAVAGMGIAVGAASSFQEQMAIINTIAHQTGPELAKTGDGIRAMATASGTPLSDLTTAYYDLLSAGIKPGADAMAMLGQANTLAIGGLATTAQTVDLLTTAVNAYGLSAKGGAVATDQFALAVQDGKVTADEIAATFADVAPLARTAGVGIDEIAASYATLTASGVKAPEAMTQMNRAMVELIKPGKELSALQKHMGVNFADIAKDKGLVVALQMMRDAAEKNHIPFADLFGRLEGLKFALATTGPHFKAYTGELEKMHHANGTAADQAAERSQTFTRQVSILGTSFNDLAISVGTGLLPPLTDFVKHLSVILQSVKEWAAANPGLASAILPVTAAVSGLIVAVLTLGPILGAIGTVIGIITSPILLVIGAIVGLAAHFGLLGNDAKGAVDGIIAKIGDLLPATGPLRDVFNGIAGGVSTLVTMLGPLASAVGQVVNAFGYIIAVVASGDDVMAGLYETVGNLGEKFSALLPVIGQTLGQLGSQLVGWIGPMIPPALAALGQFASSVFAWISRQAPGWIAQLQQWAGAFVAWIGPMIPPALAALSALAGRIVAWIGQQLPGWVAQLQRWAGAFIAWIGPMIPPVLAALGAMLGRLLAWVGQQLPGFAAAISKWAEAFIAWVGPMIPPMLAALGDLLGKALAWIGQQIPVLAGALQRMGLELVRWVIAKIPDLLAALVEFGASIGRWIIGTGAPALANLMVQMGRAFVQWVRDAGPGVVADLISWWSQVAAWLGTLPEKLLTAGLELGRALAKGIIDAIADVPNQVGQTLSKIPGVSLVGDAGNAVGGAVGGAGSVLGGIANALPHFAQGGVVPGYGPQLAVVHGGETVTPAGGRQTVINHTTVLQIGDEKIAQMFERLLYNTSSTYSSGFADSPVGVR